MFTAVFMWQLDFQALVPQTTHSALYDVSTAYWQEHLGCPLRIWAGQREARQKERDISQVEGLALYL